MGFKWGRGSISFGLGSAHVIPGRKKKEKKKENKKRRFGILHGLIPSSRCILRDVAYFRR